MMHTKQTHSQKRKRNLNRIDGESSDAVNLKQLRDQMCKPTVSRHGPLHKQNLNKLHRIPGKQFDAGQTTTTLTTFSITNVSIFMITRSWSRIFFAILIAYYEGSSIFFACLL